MYKTESTQRWTSFMQGQFEKEDAHWQNVTLFFQKINYSNTSGEDFKNKAVKIRNVSFK